MTCLVCGAVSSSTAPDPCDDDTCTETLNVILFFHKILNIPLLQCSKYLENTRTLGGGILSSLCDQCHDLVKQGLVLSNRMDKVAAELEGIKHTLLNHLLVVEPTHRNLPSQESRLKLSTSVKRCFNVLVDNDNIMEASFEENCNGIGIIASTTSIHHLGEEILPHFMASPLSTLSETYNYHSQEHEVESEEFQYEIHPSWVADHGEGEEESDFVIQNHDEADVKLGNIMDSYYDGEFGEEDEADDNLIDEDPLQPMPSNNGELEDDGDSSSNSKTLCAQRKIKLPIRYAEKLSKQGGIVIPRLKRKYTPRHWNCLLCDKNLQNATMLGIHYSQIHDNPSTWPCFACDKKFDRKEKLYNHRSIIHQNLPINQMRTKIAQLSSSPSVVLSSSRPTGLSSSSSAALSSSTSITFRKTIKKPSLLKYAKYNIPRNYSCLLCDKISFSPRELSLHYITIHNNPTSWECYSCHETFDMKHKLYQHRSTVHKNMPVNQTPNRIAMLKPKLKSTKRVIAFKKKFKRPSLTNYTPRNWICLLCDKLCNGSLHLGHHYSVEHNNPTSWRCSVCEEEFDNKVKLYRHRSIVHQNLPINNKQSMENNETTTSKIKHHVTVGPSFFRTKKTQKPFMKNSKILLSSSNHRNYVCLLCDKLFKNAIALGSHYSEHGGEQGRITRWPCSICNEEFDIRAKLYYHRKDVHKNLPINRDRVDRQYEHEVKDTKIMREEQVSLSPTNDQTAQSSESIAVPSMTTATSSNSLGRTVQNSSPTTSKFQYTCLLCDLRFPHPIAIGKHYRETHPNTTEWKCNACYRVFRFKKTLYVHRRDVHHNLPISTGRRSIKTKLKEMKDDKITTKSKKILCKKKKRNFKCVLCSIDCKNARGVAEHYKTDHHTLSKCLKCSQCHRIFNNYNSLFSHRRHYHKKQTNM